MKLQEFKNLIREEIAKVLTEDYEDLKGAHSQVMDKVAKSSSF